MPTSMPSKRTAARAPLSLVDGNTDDAQTESAVRTVHRPDDGLLVGYVESPDFQKAVDGMQTEEVNTRWQTTMKDFFTTLPGGAADTSLERLEEVFHLE